MPLAGFGDWSQARPVGDEAWRSIGNCKERPKSTTMRASRTRAPSRGMGTAVPMNSPVNAVSEQTAQRSTAPPGSVAPSFESPQPKGHGDWTARGSCICLFGKQPRLAGIPRQGSLRSLTAFFLIASRFGKRWSCRPKPCSGALPLNPARDFTFLASRL